MTANPRVRQFVLVLGLASAVAACGDRESREADRDGSRYGGTVVIANNSDLENFNSLVSADRATQEINRYLLFLPLIRYDANLDYEPALAESWELLGDTGVVFNLRQDVYWHDGVRTTARDVVFTYERATDPETAFPNAEVFANWTGVAATDSFTIRFTYQPHLDPLASLPLLPIMPAHLLDSIPAARLRQAAFNKRPVGNGPFRFVEYRTNDRTVFIANDSFPEGLGGRPYIDRIIWRPIPETTAQIAEITAGAADMILTPRASEFPELAARPGLRGLTRDSRQYAAIMWNGRIEPLNDPRVRRGLTAAINREQILQTLRAGVGQLATGPIGPYHWAYDESLPPVAYNPDSARALMAEAGLADLNGDGFLQLSDGRPFQVELRSPSGSAINRDMAEMIRSDLAQVGVRVTTRQLESNTLIQDLISPSRNFQAAIMGWESDLRVNLRDTFHSGSYDGMYQVASYRNPRVDLLIDSVARSADRAAALPIYRELQQILRDEQPWTFLYYYPDLVIMRDRLQGVEMDIRGALTNVTRWWVSGPAPADAGAPGDSADRDPGPGAEQPQ
jgi:peptide/nickel transport system substrate-binding protein